ncbi:MAG: hypothetical protein METHP_01636 [Methanoregula sp. SKADARSKE-2]|nr:MAG: hypothetical protein METHP_01636 [Methanoregula sp. SKADARSKE-2]
MGDLELRSDENVLVRTNGIFVKSLPFEGILTNRRILLIDKSKDLRPPKEISLATVKDIETGENAIRDQTITLSMVAKTGGLRQMILTFSRQTGGNRIKERDEWVKLLKKNTGQVFEQAVHRNVQPVEAEDRYPEEPAPARIGNVNSPLQQNPPARIAIQKEVEQPRPVKRIIESGPVPDAQPTPAPPPEPAALLPSSGLGLYCTRCGNKLAEGSAFCNRCGSPVNVPVIPPEVVPPAPAPTPRRTAVAEPAEQPAQRTTSEGRRETPVTGQISIPEEELSWEEMPEHLPAPVRTPVRTTLPDTISEPEFDQVAAPQDQTPPAPPEKPGKGRKGLLPRLFSPKELAPTPLKPGSMPTRSAPPAPKRPVRPSSGRGLRPGKRAIYAVVGIVVIIAVLLIGARFVYPMITRGEISLPTGTSGETTPTPTINGAAASSTPTASGTWVMPKEPLAVTIPSTGVYVYVNYIGGFKGTYGISSDLKTATDSGEKIFEVLNATGTVQADIAKTDPSTRHAITVEIYKDSNVLTSGTTDASFGKVTLSVDVATGVAKAPVMSPSTGATTTEPVKASATTSPAGSGNTSVTKTGAPGTNATTAH